MTAFLNIEKALFASVRDLSLPYPVEYANEDLETDQKSAVWLKVTNLNVRSNVATLGAKGEDNNPGILQIDVNVPRGTGTGEMLEVLDQIGTAYPAGSTLQNGGVSATVTSVSLSPLRIVEGYARRSLSIAYYSRTVRRT